MFVVFVLSNLRQAYGAFDLLVDSLFGQQWDMASSVDVFEISWAGYQPTPVGITVSMLSSFVCGPKGWVRCGWFPHP